MPLPGGASPSVAGAIALVCLQALDQYIRRQSFSEVPACCPGPAPTSWEPVAQALAVCEARVSELAVCSATPASVSEPLLYPVSERVSVCATPDGTSTWSSLMGRTMIGWPA